MSNTYRYTPVSASLNDHCESRFVHVMYYHAHSLVIRYTESALRGHQYLTGPSPWSIAPIKIAFGGALRRQGRHLCHLSQFASRPDSLPWLLWECFLLLHCHTVESFRSDLILENPSRIRTAQLSFYTSIASLSPSAHLKRCLEDSPSWLLWLLLLWHKPFNLCQRATSCVSIPSTKRFPAWHRPAQVPKILLATAPYVFEIDVRYSV